MGTLKDLIKCFYEYPMDYFPVVDKEEGIKGLISRKSSLNDVNEIEKLKSNLRNFIKENMLSAEIKENDSRIIKLKKNSVFPIVSIDGEIEIIDYENFDKIYLKKDKIDYRKILYNSSIGILIFDIDSHIIFKNKYFNIIQQQATNFDISEFIAENLLNINTENDVLEVDITVDFGGIEIAYSVSSKFEEDNNSGKIITSYFIPKTTFNNKTVNSKTTNSNDTNNNNEENLSTNKEETNDNFDDYKDKLKKYMKDEIIDLINNKNFSLKSYMDEKEKLLIETVSEILDNNTSLMAKVLKISKEEIEFKLKQIKQFID
ncbi:MAG: hypothetical protein ACOCV8_02330 [Spirochaetota bacterium]